MIFDHVPPQLPSAVPCPIAFIDATPDDSALVHGRPLCGPAGKLFNRVAEQAGVDRAACLITHVWDRELPGGLKQCCTKESQGEGSVKIPGMGWSPADFQEQWARVEFEIEQCKPKVIVPLGGTALWAVTGKTTVAQMRGTLSTVRVASLEYKMLPTFQPGIIFKQYKMRGTMIQDLCKAWSAATGTSKPRTPRELWLSPTLEDLETFWPHLESSSLISVDIETARGQVTKIGFATSSNLAIVVPFVSPVTANHSYWSNVADEMQAWDWVRRVGRLPNPKLFQNGGYDNHYLIRLGVLMWNWCHDLRILHQALYPELPKSLAYMGSVHLEERPWKTWGGKAQEEKTDA